MKTKDFSFDLPEHLIAQEPPAKRGQSRLLVANPQTGAVTHSRFENLTDFLTPDSFMVFNNSRVRKARTFAVNQHGGKVEVLFLNPGHDGSWEVLINKAKRQREGDKLTFPDGRTGVFLPGEGNIRRLAFDKPVTDSDLEIWGHIPLPPYIKRPDSQADSERYQTVYNRDTGSSAAPTAGLHFTEAMLERLQKQGIDSAFVTLHVGLGTFMPVRVDDISQHEMHTETCSIDPVNADKINQAKAAGKKILAVGTTSVRTLESFAENGRVKAGTKATSIFIYPGYQFKLVDQLITNFHTPESTLLMLVSAFAGQEFVKRVYKEAVEQEYRFFSYGDSTFFQARAQ